MTITSTNIGSSSANPFSANDNLVLSIDLNGEKGSQGFTGYTGFQGFQGFQGFTGYGAQGFTGYTGFQGFTGYTGFQGFTGYTGFQGFQGVQGFTGLQGRDGAGMTKNRDHQLLEIGSGVCDGRTINAVSGNYSLSNVNAVQEIGPSSLPSYNWLESWYNIDSYFYDISGSSINYTPPSGTRQVIYTFTFNVNEHSNNGSGGLWFRFFVGDDEVECLRRSTTTQLGFKCY